MDEIKIGDTFSNIHTTVTWSIIKIYDIGVTLECKELNYTMFVGYMVFNYLSTDGRNIWTKINID